MEFSGTTYARHLQVSSAPVGESSGSLREHHLFAVNKQIGFFGKIFQKEIDITGVLHPVKTACRLVVLPVENL